VASQIGYILWIPKMNQTADGPKGDQCPETGYGYFKKNVFPMLTETGSNESGQKQDE
jgi:hypothetical protein